MFVKNDVGRAVALAIVLFLGGSPGRAQQVTHGPIVGGVTASSARFYVRTDTTAIVNVQLSTSVLFSPPYRYGTARAAVASHDYAVLVDVDGLQPDRRYFYRAMVNGSAVSEVPPRQFRTFPEPGSRRPFTFTFGACQQVQPTLHQSQL